MNCEKLLQAIVASTNSFFLFLHLSLHLLFFSVSSVFSVDNRLGPFNPDTRTR